MRVLTNSYNFTYLNCLFRPTAKWRCSAVWPIEGWPYFAVWQLVNTDADSDVRIRHRTEACNSFALGLVSKVTKPYCFASYVI
jgi:hypothetical protein